MNRLRSWRLTSLSARGAPGKPADEPCGGNFTRRLTYVAVLLGMVAVLAGVGHLLAWLGGYLTQRGLTAITMKTNAALCLTLVGAALILLVPPEVGQTRRWMARMSAAVALLVGLLTFLENLWGWDFGIDQLLAAETPGALAVVNPNRMGTPASLSFTLTGLALLLLSRRDRRGVRVAQVLALVVCLIALLPTIGFLYGAEQFYGIARYTGIAWPTAVVLLLLGLGLLCARPAEGLMAQVTANDPGGVSIRRLLPVFVMLPLLLGWLRLAGERGGFFDTAMGTGLQMLMFIIICLALTYHAGRGASRAAQTLRESEERHRGIVETAEEGIATHAPDGTITYVNQRMAEMLGYAREEIIGRSSLDFVDDEQRQAVTGARESLKEKGGFSAERKLRRKDGSILWTLSNVTPRRDSAGNFLGYLAMHTDITARKEAEEARRASEQRVTSILETMNDCFVTLDREWRYTYVNAAAARAFHMAPQQLLGRTIWEMWPPAYDLPLGINLRRALEENVSIQFEQFYPEPLNRWFECRCHPTPEGLATFFSDITERKRAEEVLRELNATLENKVAQRTAELERQRQRLYDVLEAMPAMICLLTPDYHVAFANRSFRENFGEAHGRHCYEFCFGRTEPCEFCETYQVLQTGRPHRWEVALADGRTIIDAYDFPFTDVDGAPLILEMDLDITERKRAEAALRELNETLSHRARQLQKLTLELTEAEERERRRIAVILHEDLQQQIAGAKFHLNVVKARIRDDRMRAQIEAVETMLKQAIEQSRDLSRDLSPAVVHMNDLAEVLQWLAHRVGAQQGLSVQVEVLGDMMLHAEALAMFLFRAAQEMLFNVVKHAQVREAAVRARRIGRYVCLCISDQGRGFDPQELKRTSGIGLFSIRERTELLGGRFKVKSAKGKGSRFSIMVPDGRQSEDRGREAEDGRRADEGALSSVLRPPSSVLRVLLVDDHDVVRQGLAALLREAPGIELVGEAPDGRQAINMAMDLRPDVVIMDVSMPLMSGAQATRQIKTYLPQTRVIALSMYDEADKKQKMFEAGAEGYILKTISAEELLAAICGRSQTNPGAAP